MRGYNLLKCPKRNTKSYMYLFSALKTMIYSLSFFLYLCVDICYDIHKVNYNAALISDIKKGKEGSFINRYPHICKFCITKWKESAIGNAAEYTTFYFFSRLNLLYQLISDDGSVHFGSNWQEVREETGDQHISIIPGNLTSLQESGFDVNKKTVLLIHGWMDTAFIKFPYLVRRGYLSAQDVNVLVLDWSRMAGAFYLVARVAVDPVGEWAAKMVDWLFASGVPQSSLHLVGHSLGAHVAGVIGEHVRVARIARITGLDPAGPGFESLAEGRLDPTDADFVDVIHTAGLWAGYYHASGHVDFYPNGGLPDQPGCSFGDWGLCSHVRAYLLFIESLTSNDFVAHTCKSWWDYSEGSCQHTTTNVMGENVNKTNHGKFYLRTAGQPPFALGRHHNIQYIS